MALSREEFYDTNISPILLDLAQQCEAEGLSLIAMCEFAPNETERTRSIRDGAGIEIVMADMAMRARGNADALLLGLRRYGKEHGHESVMLHLLDGADPTTAT